MRIVLIGFMGSGKSTVAPLLAKKLGYRSIENDEELLNLTECSSINEIFERDGEEEFRRLEREALKLGLAEDSVVISSGGGIIKEEENRSLLKGDDVRVVFLSTKFETVKTRLAGDTDRPLFRDLAAAEELYSERQELYRSVSDIVVDTDSLSPEEVSSKILELLS